MRGMLLAYRTLCTLFCRRHTHTYTTPQQQQQQSSSYELSQLLAHFYRIIHVVRSTALFSSIIVLLSSSPLSSPLILLSFLCSLLKHFFVMLGSQQCEI